MRVSPRVNNDLVVSIGARAVQLRPQHLLEALRRIAALPKFVAGAPVWSVPPASRQAGLARPQRVARQRHRTSVSTPGAENVHLAWAKNETARRLTVEVRHSLAEQ